MKLKKPKHWDYKKPNIVAYLLLPFSLILLTVNFFKQLITKFTNKNHTEIKTICVGNIYTGGTGKTPAAKEIFKITKSLGKNPAFIKKYYDYVNDEINMLKNIGETFVSKKREISIKNLVKNGYNLAILDDGFQDFSIKNNLNIVCFNQKQWIGNGLIIPAGPLREKLNNLNKYEHVFLNGNLENIEEISNEINKINPKINIHSGTI